MPVYNKVIFVCMDNICQSPMAATLMKNMKNSQKTAVSRRILAQIAEICTTSLPDNLLISSYI